MLSKQPSKVISALFTLVFCHLFVPEAKADKLGTFRQAIFKHYSVSSFKELAERTDAPLDLSAAFKKLRIGKQFQGNLSAEYQEARRKRPAEVPELNQAEQAKQYFHKIKAGLKERKVKFGIHDPVTTIQELYDECNLGVNDIQKKMLHEFIKKATGKSAKDLLLYFNQDLPKSNFSPEEKNECALLLKILDKIK